MIKKRSILIFALLLIMAESVFAQGSAESKIKNGKLLAGKALSSQGDTRADYIIKAKRELERASLSEPENAQAYYWQAVVAFYLERDSVSADKLYSKALQYADKKTKALPLPWAYQTDDNLSAAIAGDFAWAQVSSAPVKLAEEPKKEKPKELVVNPLQTIASLITAENFVSAESLYTFLSSNPEKYNKDELALSGLKLKLAEDSIGQATALLDNIQKTSNRRSQVYKKAVELYDSVLDPALTKIKGDAQQGEYSAAWDSLSKWEPERQSPVTPGRGKMLLIATSVSLSKNNTEIAASSLALYESLGYDKDRVYQDLKKRAAPPEKPIEIAEKPVVAQKPVTPQPLPVIQKVPGVSNMVTLLPPGNEIVKVLVNKIDPITGEVNSTELWQTSAPMKLKTGSAYRLVIQKKQEKVAPRYIALAAMLATFLIVR
jgi:hypothetical protein